MTDVSKCRALFLAGNALHRCEHAAGGASQRLLRNRPPCTTKTFTWSTNILSLRTHYVRLLSSMGTFVYMKVLQGPEPFRATWKLGANMRLFGLGKMASIVSVQVCLAQVRLSTLFANKRALRCSSLNRVRGMDAYNVLPPLYAIDNALTTETALNKTWNIRNMYKDIVLFAQLRRKVQAPDQEWTF